MNCPNCGYQVSDGSTFCLNCGLKLTGTAQGAASQASAQAPSQQAPSQQAAPFQGYAPNPYPPAPQVIVNNPDPADRVPSKGDYIVWMLIMPLLNLIPIIGNLAYIIMVFVRAFDTSFKARANYFKAILTIWLIFFIIGLIGGIVVAILVATGVFAFSELGYYLPF